MNWRKILYWLPLPLILAAIGYLLIFRQVTVIPLTLIISAFILGGLSAQLEKPQK